MNEALHRLYGYRRTDLAKLLKRYATTPDHYRRATGTASKKDSRRADANQAAQLLALPAGSAAASGGEGGGGGSGDEGIGEGRPPVLAGAAAAVDDTDAMSAEALVAALGRELKLSSARLPTAGVRALWRLLGADFEAGQAVSLYEVK